MARQVFLCTPPRPSANINTSTETPSQEQHAYPIFTDDWGADEELLLIDGCQTYGLGNWADIADHIGNRSKEEVEAHYVAVYVEGRDGTAQGDERAERIAREAEANPTRTSRQLPMAGPNMDFAPKISADEFHQAKRRRISDLRSTQAALPLGPQKGAPPKPLVSAPTSHHELSGFMAGRLEFETEHEQDAETLTKDMEFGKVYSFGGELLPSEEQALGGKAVGGRSRMEASGRGGPSSRGAGSNKAAKGADESQAETQDPAGKEEGEEDDTDAPKDPDETTGDVTMDGDSQSADTKPPTASTDEQQTQSQSQAPAAEAPAEPTERPPADWDEDPHDLELKLMILDMYNERLERRVERKSAILERGLVEVRRRQAAERRRPKEERDLLARVRHFARLQTPMDFEEFFDGLCYQESLKRLASQLQEYRRAGLTTLSEASKYEAEKAERQRKANLLAEEGGTATTPAPTPAKRGPSVARKTGRDSETPFGEDDSRASIAPPPPKREKPTEPKPPRKPPRPLDLSSHPSLHLLTRPEQVLCSTQRIQPSAFLVMKKAILAEYIRRMGKMSRRESRTLFHMDVNKVGKVYDLLEEQGYLQAARSIGWDAGADGVGTPPGWKDPTANGANGHDSAGPGAGAGPQVNGVGHQLPSPSAQRLGAGSPGRHTPGISRVIGPSPLSQQQHGDTQKTHSPYRPTATV